MGHHHHHSHAASVQKKTPEEIQSFKAFIVQKVELKKEADAFLQSKVTAAEIKPLNKYEKDFLVNKYIEVHATNPNVIAAAKHAQETLPQRIDEDYKRAERKRRHKLRDKQKRAIWKNRLYNLGKIVAIGCVASFAGPLVGPIIAELGFSQAVATGIATGAACAATDAAAQRIGIQLKIQENFSMNELIETAFSAGIGAGAAKAGLGVFGRATATAAGGSLAQSAEIVAGTRDEIDLKAIGMQVASSLVSSGVNKATELVDETLTNTLPQAVEMVGKENVSLITNTLATSAADSAMSKAVNGAPLSVEGMLLNNLGSAVANKLSHLIKESYPIVTNVEPGDVNDNVAFREEDLQVFFDSIEETLQEVHETISSHEVLVPSCESNPIPAAEYETVPFDYEKGVEAVKKGIQNTTTSLLKTLRHPIDAAANLVDTAKELGTMSWDGYNAITDATLGVSTEGSRARNIQRANAIDEGMKDVDIYKAIELGTEMVSGGLFAGGAIRGARKGLSFFKNGNETCIKSTGAFSSSVKTKNYDLGKLEGKEIKITKKGYDLVNQHLSQFGPIKENQLMLKRLENALENNLNLTGADASFYIHEVTEASKMKQGMNYPEAHMEALNKYEVSPFSVYHPDVIDQINLYEPGTFNTKWSDFWTSYVKKSNYRP